LRVTREIKTAILVIASYFYLGLQFFFEGETFSTYQTFYTEYNDSVEGLAMSAPITLNGLVIGKVTVKNQSNTDAGRNAG
jgi:phospholipid/cholesterol/gamma-HCH transport system substrate-binding protein